MDFFRKLEQNSLCFNENQKKAIMHKEGPMLVAAGPGSGKTSVIAARTAYLIQKEKVDPSCILVITFTRAAANEMKQRFKNFPGIKDEQSRKVEFGTFHSIFYKIICTYYGRYLPVLDQSKTYGIIKSILKSLYEPYDDDTVQNILTDISVYRTSLQNPEEFKPQNLSSSKFQTVFSQYEKQKKNLKSIDFDDMMIMCKNILETNSEILSSYRKKYRYLLVDEFQDTCMMQFEIVKLISQPYNNLFVVGDDDQAIYGFRGTIPDCLTYFKSNYSTCTSATLDINYRSTNEIVTFSKIVISHNSSRIEKDLRALRGNGEGPFLLTPADETSEADFIAEHIENAHKEGIPYNNFAVLYRMNIQSRPVVDEMIKRNIPFNVRDNLNNFYEHWISKDITSYLKLSINASDKTSILRIINRPVRYIPRESINKALSYYGRDTEDIENIFHDCGLKVFQMEKIHELSISLSALRKMRPSSAVNFIRNTIRYDAYVRTRCMEQNIGFEEFMGILDEYEISSSNFSSIPEFLSHIDKVSLHINNGGNHLKYGDDFITLSTIHGAKGLEFETVFVIDCIEGFIPHAKCLRTGEDIQEERRLLYVAVTRSKNRLFVLSPVKYHGKRIQTSRFLTELPVSDLSKKRYDGDSNKFRLGELISHKVYGTGKIIELNNSSALVQFNNKSGKKMLDMDTCIRNKLIEK